MCNAVTGCLPAVWVTCLLVEVCAVKYKTLSLAVFCSLGDMFTGESLSFEYTTLSFAVVVVFQFGGPVFWRRSGQLNRQCCR